MNETWSQSSRCPKSRVQLEALGVHVGKKSTELHWDKYASETRLHGMWAKSLTSLGPSFLICAMKILMPTSCDRGEIKIMCEIMYKSFWGVSQCVMGMQNYYSCLRPRAGKQKSQEESGPSLKLCVLRLLVSKRNLNDSL